LEHQRACRPSRFRVTRLQVSSIEKCSRLDDDRNRASIRFSMKRFNRARFKLARFYETKQPPALRVLRSAVLESRVIVPFCHIRRNTSSRRNRIALARQTSAASAHFRSAGSDCWPGRALRFARFYARKVLAERRFYTDGFESVIAKKKKTERELIGRF